MFRKLWIILLALFLFEIPSLAQTTTGLMTGSVTDSSGAVVPGAEVDCNESGDRPGENNHQREQWYLSGSATAHREFTTYP